MRYIMRVQTELRVRVAARVEGDKTRAGRKVSIMGIIIRGTRPRLRLDSRLRRSLVPFTLLIESLLGYRGDLSD